MEESIKIPKVVPWAVGWLSISSIKIEMQEQEQIWIGRK